MRTVERGMADPVPRELSVNLFCGLMAAPNTLIFPFLVTAWREPDKKRGLESDVGGMLRRGGKRYGDGY